jgi:uncharacterized membrane protein
MGLFKEIVEITGYVIEATGVLVIVLGFFSATVWFIVRLRKIGLDEAYSKYRIVLGRTILLGLEFLLAGDIIRTVVVTPTLEQVGVLAVIVLIRTFLSLTLEVEIEGKWPWQMDS